MKNEPLPGIDDVIASLRVHKIFQALPDSTLRHLATQSKIRTYDDGTTIFRQGQIGQSAYLLITGDLAIEADTDDGKILVGRLGPGALVGEVAAFSELPRTASLVAIGECHLLELKQEQLKTITREYPEIAAHVIGELGDKLSSLNRNLAYLTDAAEALCDGDYDKAKLDALKNGEDRFGHLASLLEKLAFEIAEKRNRAQEMQTAIQIQRSFLPQPYVSHAIHPHVQIATYMEPARDVGGDFYDYFWISKDRLMVAVGDISGKGIPAAIFMSMCRTILKTLSGSYEQVAKIATRMNEIIAEDNEEGMFVTLFFGILDVPSGILTYCNAAHDDVFLKRKDATVEQIPVIDPAIGIFGARKFQSQTLQFGPGDTLCVATDGISEGFDTNRNVYGAKRLIEKLNEMQEPVADNMLSYLLDDLRSHVGDAEPSDDITALVLTLQDAPSAAP